MVYDNRFHNFLIVGGVSYLLNLLLLYSLTSLAGLHYMVSAFLAFAIVNSSGYVMNRRYTFKKTGSVFWRGLWKYTMVMLSSCFWVLVMMYVMVDYCGVRYILANIMITGGITVYNFFLHRKWTFG